MSEPGNNEQKPLGSCDVIQNLIRGIMNQGLNNSETLRRLLDICDEHGCRIRMVINQRTNDLGNSGDLYYVRIEPMIVVTKQDAQSYPQLEKYEYHSADIEKINYTTVCTASPKTFEENPTINNFLKNNAINAIAICAAILGGIIGMNIGVARQQAHCVRYH